MENAQRSKNLKMAQLAILTAIIIVMNFTPLGYFQLGPISITFLMIPVAIGAILLGPAAGAILGFIFGATSFARCFGLEAFGTFLLSVNPFYTFVLCMVPRVLMGWLVGLIFKALMKMKSNKFLPYLIASASGAILNSVLFISMLYLFFGRNAELLKMLGGNFMNFIISVVITNSLIELAICIVVGSGVTKAVAVALGRIKPTPAT